MFEQLVMKALQSNSEDEAISSLRMARKRYNGQQLIIDRQVVNPSFDPEAAHDLVQRMTRLYDQQRAQALYAQKEARLLQKQLRASKNLSTLLAAALLFAGTAAVAFAFI